MKTCKNCCKELVCVFSHKTSRGASKSRNVYKDDLGRFWSAATCPTCSGKYAKRSQGKAAKPLTKRECTICKSLLPEGRRYMHEECQSIASNRYYDIEADYEFVA